MERTADGRIRTTEWEEIQYKYGNKVGKYQTHELEILTQKIADKHDDTCLRSYNPQEEKLADKLNQRCAEGEGQDAEIPNINSSDDEDEVLAEIRQRRMAELKRQLQTECFGTLRHISGANYVKEITESSEKNCVVAALIKPGHSDCESLLNVLRTVAQRNRDSKFVSMISTEAIPNFPDKHLPCVLLYANKSVKTQITGLETWKHKGQLSVHTVERVLKEQGFLNREDLEQYDA
ncbi:unnamed protein product [Phytomonas sp. Hart1]|nr:unnamed protein product [Phytomonas sp. Hart1]|eukprot:CCW66095.1 unnamed protein product [Phytomonas sp. isolate Hart1]